MTRELYKSAQLCCICFTANALMYSAMQRYPYWALVFTAANIQRGIIYTGMLCQFRNPTPCTCNVAKMLRLRPRTRPIQHCASAVRSEHNLSLSIKADSCPTSNTLSQIIKTPLLCPWSSIYHVLRQNQPSCLSKTKTNECAARQGRLVKSRRVELMPTFQCQGNYVQRDFPRGPAVV